MPRARSLALGGALLTGVLLALQSRLNGTLSAHTDRPIIAALWSFGSGLVILTVLALALPQVRGATRDLPAAIRDGRLRWYQCLGGVIGGLFVAVQTYAVPAIGVAIFSVAVLGGQAMSGLAVDQLGWGSGGRRTVTPGRIVFSLVGVAGVVVSATGHHGGGEVAVLPVLLALGIGCGIAVQQGINARVNRAIGQPLATTWQNFLLGTIVLTAVGLITWATQPGPWSWPSDAPWWAWFGAVCGIAFIAITALAVHELGVLVFGLVSVSGQLLAAVVLDLLDPSVRPSVGPALLLGVAISLVAAVGAGLLASRRPSARH